MLNQPMKLTDLRVTHLAAQGPRHAARSLSERYMVQKETG